MNEVGLHNLASTPRQKPKRVGRGRGSGLGKTAGRGTKGQNARSGGGVRPGFEGGQTPIQQLIPKLRGFTSHFKNAAVINVGDIDATFKAGDTVNLKSLKKAGLISRSTGKVKILGQGDTKKKLTIQVSQVSKSAKGKFEKAGGSVATNKPLAKKEASKKSSKK